MTILPSQPRRNNQQDSAKTDSSVAPPERTQTSRQMRSQVLSSHETNADKSSDAKLRPQSLEEYIGQSKLKDMLNMSIKAAQARSEVLDHVLLYGPPGLGKTTLAGVVANEMGGKLYLTSGPSLERPRDILGLLHQLEAGDVLFIDEIHRLSRTAEELLYPAIEDFVIDLTSGKGQTTRTMRLPLPKFTLIGATTKAGMLSNALRDRFGFVLRLDYYSLEELGSIVKRTASILDVEIDPESVSVIASRGRGTPRIVNRLVRLVRDYTQYQGHSRVTAELAAQALNAYQVDRFGLDHSDRRFLEVLIDTYNGGPAGIEAIAAALGEDSSTLEDVLEPYLIQVGFIQRTSRGRQATPQAFKHLGRQISKMQLALDFNQEENSKE